MPFSYFGNLRWAEFLIEETGGEIGVADYHNVAENGLFDGLGDWAFTGVLHDDPTFGVETLRKYATGRSLDIGLVERMRAYADTFVDLVVAEILELDPELVGFTTTFMQNVPSLAVAKRLKSSAPWVPLLFGGGNCDGPMGAALHRNFRFVDYVTRGEGERSFPALLTTIDEAADLSAVPGLCWWDDGIQRCNAQPPPVAPAELLTPDFDDWFERLGDSSVQSYIEPKLVLESARGCWWGEKHHCTFCGLNGTQMAFRAKAPETVVAEIGSMVSRHRVLDVIMVDNIIDNGFFKSVLPLIAELGWDLRIHYEVKANLKSDEIKALSAAGIVHVQPGIESLVSPVLKIMDKGVTGIQNVRTLRDCESNGLTVSWNWLYGFPAERADDYAEVLGQLPALAHLQPPAGASRILLERFSPYFDDPAAGFPERSTAAAYRHVYALDEIDLKDMVYLFDTGPVGLPEDMAEALHARLDAWSAAYTDSSLRYVPIDGALVFEDRRVGWPESNYWMDDPVLIRAYGELQYGRSVSALVRRLAEADVTLSDDRIASWLSDLRDRGLVFEERGRWLALATSSRPIKMRAQST